MVIASSTGRDGRRMLILGLERENIDRLLDDMPVEQDLGDVGVPGMEEWKVYVLGPEDTARFVAQMGGKVRPG